MNMTDLKELVIIIITGILTILLAIISTYWVADASCSNYGERTGQQTDYSLINGCMVKSGDTWKPAKHSVELINQNKD